MTGASRSPAVSVPSDWSIRSAPRRFAAFILLIDLIALIWAVTAVVRLPASPKEWGVTAFLVGLALLFEESARRAARLQLRLSSDMKRDMTSVWCVAAAVGLRPGFAVLLLLCVMTYVWFRQQRPANELLHRKVFNASTALLGCLGAGLVLHTAGHAWGGYPWMLSGAVSVFVVIVVHTLSNRSLVTTGLTVLGVRGRVLLGSADDNLVELATLCLGGLVALAVLHQPWLAILVLPPLITLQRGALVRELETAATTDAKTGLLNAVAWEQVARRELSRAERDGTPVAFLIVDIDRFKLVNDRFGHVAGDTVLRGVGRCLQNEVREYDTVGRFGGEEFVAVLPEADVSAALVVAERLRSCVHEMRISTMLGSSEVPADDLMAVSIGVACSPVDGTEFEELLVAADSALYRAKAAGRNRVILAERGTPGTMEPAAHD